MEPAYELDENRILRVVDRVLEVKPDALVAGQTENRALLQKIVSRAHQKGVKVHQWSSLFSENDHAADFDPLIGADGKPQERVFGDQFNFRCSASARNVELFIQMQDKSMEGIDFDGVFLDRVRYPSWANGALSCFCPECLKRYEAAGLDADRLRRLDKLPITGFSEGRHVFADEETSAFFALRAQRITEAVKMLKAHYGEVSLDLFPPQMAYLVGQSVKDLAPLAAFVKPMYYRYTTAPAGLPFELEAYGHETCGSIKEYESTASGLYWGVEGGYIPGIAEMTPDRIRESLAFIRENGGTGVCASWSAVNFPEENLEVFLNA